MATMAEDMLAHRLTQRDLDYTPDDGNRYELIDGVMYVSPFPTYGHQQALAQLFYVLKQWTGERGLGTVLPAGLKVVLDEPTGVGPDITFIATERMTGMQSDGFYGPPDLIVEVVSSKPQLDRYVKFRKYASAGVSCYWIIDPERHTLEAFGLVGTSYQLEAECARTDTFRPARFPGLAIDLAALWT